MKTATCPIQAFSSHISKSNQVQAVAENRLCIEVVDSIADVSMEEWKVVVPDNRFLLGYDWLLATEMANREYLNFKYVLVKDGPRPVLAACFQVVPFDLDKTLTYAYQGKSRATKLLFKAVRSTVPKTIGLLVGGTAFLSGSQGWARHESITEAEAFEYVRKAERKICKEDKSIRAILLKDYGCTEDYPVEGLKKGKYRFFATDPSMKVSLDPSWQTFEEYMHAMTSKYRQRVKSAYKKSKAISVRALSLDELIAHRATMYSLLGEILNDAGFSLFHVPADYFISLKKHLGDAFLVNGYFLNGELIGFMSYIRQPDQIICHFTGFQASLNRSHKLYQRMLYDSVKLAIGEGFASLDMGRTAMEIKSTLGATPSSMDCYLKLRNPFLNQVVAPILKRVEADPWVSRHPFKTPELEKASLDGQ